MNWPTIRRELPRHPLLGEQITKQLLYYPTVTREPFRHEGRIPALLETGRLCHDIGLAGMDAKHDRFMLCGSPAMLEELPAMFAARGFVEGNHSQPGHFVIEKAFVER